MLRWIRAYKGFFGVAVMDGGEVIPGLGDDWTFAGAKAMEWISGFVMAMIFLELFLTSTTRSMPIFLGVLVTTTFGLATMRRRFPDEERGVANCILTELGLCPPGIPAPAALQPLWSGAPVRAFQENKEFTQLGLEHLFASIEDEDEEISLEGGLEQ